MSIDVTGADAYFAAANHPRSSVWLGFGTNFRTAAIAVAKRTWGRVLKREMEDPEDADDVTEFPRDDYTIYEQALFDLENGLIADGTLATTKFIAGRTMPDEPRERSTDVLGPQAIRWQFRGRIMITRG
jgi:hypothetical protein